MFVGLISQSQKEMAASPVLGVSIARADRVSPGARTVWNHRLQGVEHLWCWRWEASALPFGT